MKCCYLAAKIRFLLLYRRSLQTTKNTHMLNSVRWMYTLKPVLLGSSPLVLQADIFQYCVYFHSLWNIKTQLLEERCFKLSESKHGFNCLRWMNPQRSILKDTFGLCSRRRFTTIAKMLLFGRKISVFCFFTESVYKLLQKHISLTLYVECTHWSPFC